MICNPVFARMLGRAVDEVTGTFYLSLFLPSERDKAQRMHEEADRFGQVRFQSRMMRKDGTAIDMEIALGSMEAQRGERLTIVEIRDIAPRLEAERKRRVREAQLRQSQKMEAVGRLSGGIAHNFNTLLQVISINAEMAESLLSPGVPAVRQIERIANAAARAGDLTRRLLTVSRRQPLVPKAIDLRKLVADLLPKLERTLPETITIEVIAKGSPPTVFVDPGALESILVNLTVNARDAMSDGGRLTIETETVAVEPNLGGGDVPPGAYCMIAVADTGCGMTAEVCDRVFEPFFTTKEVGKGIGLGLSIVYGFVQQSGGYVGIDSVQGRGTRVTIRLPIMEEAATELSALSPYADLPRGSETVLVVQDDEMVRVHAVESIKGLGYRVIEAKNGYDALYFLATNPGIDLLFTDAVMPGGVNGKQLAERAKKIKPSLGLVFTSGCAGSIGDLTKRDVVFLPNLCKRDQLAWALRAALTNDPS